MADAAEVSALEAQVIGAWRLVRTEQTLASGERRPKPEYGPNGTGYILYDASHVMSVFLANPNGVNRAPSAPRGAPGSSMDTPAAYCGRWHIDPAGPTLVHHTEMDVFPSEAGLVRRRRFTCDGDTLILRPPEHPPGVVDFYLQFERVR
jgi:hypothetical protein